MSKRNGGTIAKSDAHARLILGGGAALLVALLAGSATTALLAFDAPVSAQPVAKPYGDQKVADQVAKAEAVTRRCDKAAARKEIANLKKTKEILDTAVKSGFAPQAVADDAKKIGEDIASLERNLRLCSDKNKAAGPNGESYGFLAADMARDAGKHLDDARSAARACDRDLYKAVIKALHEAIERHRKNYMGGANAGGLSIEALRQVESDLIANEAAAFAHCAPPGKAEQPKAEAPKEPAKTEPPKTGTGTGATPGQAPKPPEPPKAPPMTPGVGQAPGRMPANVFGPQNVFLQALYLPAAEFSIALGFRNNNANGHYLGSITAPGSGEGSETRFNFGGGATLWFPFYNFQTGTYFDYPSARDALRRELPQLAQAGYDDGPDFHEAIAGWVAFQTLALGGRVTLDHLGSGEKRVLELVRHGADGVVSLTESERSMISLLLLVRMSFVIRLGNIGPVDAASRGDELADSDLAQAPRARRERANWWPVNVYLGGGPSFVRTKISMTSNQVPGGGVFESVSQTKTDTAWSFVLGAQTAVCRACIFGKPLMAGLEGQWTWLPSRSVTLTSSTFGFTETGRVDGRSSARMMFTLSVPFVIR